MKNGSLRCPLCGENTITILGMSCNDNVEVECSNECDIYELEPDGLGLGGHEEVLARCLDEGIDFEDCI